MSAENSTFSGAARSKLYREQLLTTEDLREFKAELLEEIGKLLLEVRGESSKKWLKSQEVRELLGISPGTLQNLRVNGTLPFMKVGGVIFYDFDDIRKMLEETKSQNKLSLDLFQDRHLHTREKIP
ncbi:helix-turn-helix domain-containing protein [Cesiribacter sp. SM1]|uniref:helix-turn-helix domain-containing protein n=1 Tax=Cesiribacter sp. SM1 TaxID=2861196 RepID=UPI001CD80A7E|nr:helix-turn-helix domain-containing protein [Cesiribacter sp. SM1]